MFFVKKTAEYAFTKSSKEIQEQYNKYVNALPEGGKAINSFGKFVDNNAFFGQFDMLKKVGLEDKTWGQAAKEVFYKDPTKGLNTDNLNYMAAVGTGMTTVAMGSAAIGGVRALVTDSAGNADLAGIPFI